MWVSITLDLHHGDLPEDITMACEWLQYHDIRATFFIPTGLLGDPALKVVLRSILSYGHEVASHSHLHSHTERRALIHGEQGTLSFLAESKARHEDFFGVPAVAFRSPCWGFLSEAALDMLEGLGYRVDSSATPQRLSLLGSDPYVMAWTFAPRTPYSIRPRLLEVPTSCFLVPAASHTFALLRRYSYWFLTLLVWEARHFPGRVLTLKFHVMDFNPTSQRRRKSRRLKLVDLVPLPQNGFGFRYLLLDSDPRRMHERMQAIMCLLEGAVYLTMRDVLQRYEPQSPLEAPS
jgi:peptidoglycan/xylan/chitin deacetylase (PgdA/CDA1 family)